MSDSTQSLYFSETTNPHGFDPRVATQYGVYEAILISHFQYWIRHNKNMSRNFHEGRTWSYQTLQEIAAHFDYFSVKQIERIIVSLVDSGVLLRGNFNKSKFDRTVWYAFVNEKMFSVSSNREKGVPISGNKDPQIGEPIPDPISISYTHDDDDDAREITRESDCGNVHNSPKDQPIPKNVEKTNYKGEKIQCSKDDYFRYCNNKMTVRDWTVAEIDEAWMKFVACVGQIGDWKRYLDEIINNNRKEKVWNLQKRNEKKNKESLNRTSKIDKELISEASLLEQRSQLRKKEPMTAEQWQEFQNLCEKK